MTSQAADQAGSLGRVSAGRAGAAGLAATAASVAATFTVAVLGPSVMEPALPGQAGQPPWSVATMPSPYLVVALTAFAILAGTAGVALTLRATRRGWMVSPKIILAAGILGAIALALVSPFGSSDHLSYAAYGRMVVTGHDPFTTTPAALARLGDPVARAVQDWRSTPSVYGSLATGGQALASAIGGTSVRLTVFVLSLLDVAAFAVTGLLLHWLARGDRSRQLRAALLWTCNPLLLQVLIAGAHVDSQAIVFAVGAVAVFSLGLRPGSPRADRARTENGGDSARLGIAAAGAGALIGLGFAVKVTMALVGAGLAIGCLLAWRARQRPLSVTGKRPLVLPLAALAAGFCVTAGASLGPWGLGALSPALREGSFVSIGSPWRAVRSALRLATGEGAAENLVKAAAVLLVLVLLALLLRSISLARPGNWPQVPGLADTGTGLARVDAGLDSAAARGDRAIATGLAVAGSFAVVFAWLVAWPYVLPWYDGLGWAFLALLPLSRLDWLMLARTAALAVGYLPGRTVVMPADLGWLRTVVRTGVTPVVLLAVTVALVMMLWPRRDAQLPAPTADDADSSRDAAVRNQHERLA
jgi:alpha-1,6-mannosyltransferase